MLCGYQEFDATPVLQLIEMLLSIAHEDRQKWLTSSVLQQQAPSSQLEHLICSLQSRLLAWCQQWLIDGDDSDDGDDKDAVHLRRHSRVDEESRLVVQTMIVRCMYHMLTIITIIMMIITNTRVMVLMTKTYECNI